MTPVLINLKTGKKRFSAPKNPSTSSYGLTGYVATYVIFNFQNQLESLWSVNVMIHTFFPITFERAKHFSTDCKKRWKFGNGNAKTMENWCSSRVELLNWLLCWKRWSKPGALMWILLRMRSLNIQIYKRNFSLIVHN